MKGPGRVGAGVILVLTCLCAPALALGGDRAHPFRLAQVVALGDQPGAIASADFDRDGRQDIALTVHGDSTILVYRGRADATLGAPLRYPFHGGTGYALELLAGDVDGDGWSDLVIGEDWNTSALHFLRNRGDGTFEPDRMIQIPLPSDGSGLRWDLGDVDHDGRADLVVPGPNVGELNFLHSLGASGFAAPVTLPHNFKILHAKLADANHDGLADLIAIGADSVAVHFALGGGAWSAPVVSAIHGGIAVGDQDGDGMADVWVFGPTEGAVYRGVGDGTFTSPPTPPQDNLRVGEAVAICDLNGDGRADALLNSTGDSVLDSGMPMYLGAPDGSLRMRGVWNAGSSGMLVTLDYDGDGIPDLATISRDSNDLRLMRGLGNARFNDPSLCRSTAPGQIALADVDGDGRADLMVVGFAYPYSLSVYRGDSTGVMPLAQRVALSLAYPFGLALADLDGDGRTDAVVTSTDGGLASQGWLHGNGDATFAAETMLTGDVRGAAQQVVAADFDGDGFTDIVMDGATNSGMRVAWGQGGGTFGPLLDTTVPYGRLALTRLPGDSVASLLLASGSLRVIRSGGDRTWSVVSDSWLAANPGMLVTADLDGDHRPDAIMTQATTVEVHLGIGDHFGPATGYACGDATHRPYGVAVGDVDGDGLPDLVVTNAFTGSYPRGGTVTVWYNMGGGTFGDRVDFDPGGSLVGFCALGDVDGDGALDLAVANGGGYLSYSSQDVLVLMNSASGVTTSTRVDLFRAIPTTGGIQVEWELGDPSAFQFIEPQRSASATGPWIDLPQPPRVQGSVTSVIDADPPAGQLRWYRLNGRLLNGDPFTYGPISARGQAPPAFALHPLWPNPSSGQSRVSYAVPRTARIRLTLTDVQGREVARLTNGVHEAGTYTATFDERDLRAGIYFVRMQADGVSLTQRLAVVK